MTSAVEPEIPMLSIEHGNHNSKVWPESSETTLIPQHQTSKVPTRSSFVKWWLFEILAIILSFASIVTLVIVLEHYNGRAQHNLDLPAGLTLNAIIAAISTVTGVTLMIPVTSGLSQDAWLSFSDLDQKRWHHSPLGYIEVADSASRGAWGSLQILFAVPRRYIACTGAIITILSLGLGTFIQQLIAIESLPLNGNNNSPGNIPLSRGWVVTDGNPAEGGAVPPQSFQLATYAGIILPTVQPLSAFCPTSNCTWPVTPSLAVCGACSHTNYTTSCNSTGCTFTMPSGSTMTIQPGTISGATVMEGVAFQIQFTPGSIYVANDTSRVYLANFDVFGQPFTTDTNRTWTNTSIVSSECALWACVQAYQVSVDSLQQQQLTIQSWSDTITPPVNITRPFYQNSTFKPLPTNMNPTPDVQYTFGMYAATTIGKYLDRLLSGNVTLDLESDFPSNNYIEFNWNSSSNLDSWINNLAVSMSNAVRTGEPAQDSRYNGVAFVLGVSVHWYWLSLPLLMVALSLVVLISNILRTSRSQVGAWKGSSLAMLFCDIDPEVKDKAGFAMYRSGGLMDVVGKADMLLEAENDGKWKFKPA